MPFHLQLEYRNANVIDFGNEIDLGDLKLSKDDIDDGDTIVLPTARDIRITIYPVCSDKPGKPEYFGFAKTRINEELYRVGESFEFFVREDADDEEDFFKPGLESHQLQGLYLQPDPPQVNNPLTLVASIVAGSELSQSTLMERIASQLKVDYKGQTLIGKPGERIQFGCSSRIRHTLAPDNSSLTFATSDELLGHWLCVLSFEVQRDWTWDGLADQGIEVRRVRQFTGEAATAEDEVVGYVQWHKSASRVATTDPDRSYTRIVFMDAVEPKKDNSKAATAARPFPNTIDVSYTLTPRFIDSVAPAASREAATRDVQLPVTIVPAQVPKIVGAGYALSPYLRNHEYSETAVRQRYLWLEFEEPIRDPNDTYFARVLAYAPDPLLSFPNPDQALVRQDDPPLAIDPELIRVITHGHGNDNAGIDAMQPMIEETAEPSTPLMKVTPVHYLLPLPPGLHSESPELFGFFTYELRVGHTDRIWCTAQGRFGHHEDKRRSASGAAPEGAGGANAGRYVDHRAIRGGGVQREKCHEQAAEDGDLVHALRAGAAGRRTAASQHLAHRSAARPREGQGPRRADVPDEASRDGSARIEQPDDQHRCACHCDIHLDGEGDSAVARAVQPEGRYTAQRAGGRDDAALRPVHHLRRGNRHRRPAAVTGSWSVQDSAHLATGGCT